MLMVPGESEASQGHHPPEGQTVTNQSQGQSVVEDALDLRTSAKQDGDAVRVEVVPYSEIIDMSCTRKRKKPKTVKEALIRKKKVLTKGVKVTVESGMSSAMEPDGKKRKRAKSKKNKNSDKLPKSVDSNSGLGEGSASGQITPGSLSETDSQRPKYSLTSLIEALRESIERDKSKGPSALPDGIESNGEKEQKAVKSGQIQGVDICYDDLSSSTPSDEEEEDDDGDDILEVEGMNPRIGDSEENNVQVSVKTFQVCIKLTSPILYENEVFKRDNF